MPAYVVDDPDQITIAKIKAESNVEVRRVMIERYGEDRYIVDSGMRPVAADRFGELFLENLNVGKPIAAVRVINSTPEADGSYKRYMLPINPELYNGDAGRYPHAAVASTWRTTKAGKELAFANYEDYQPTMES